MNLNNIENPASLSLLSEMIRGIVLVLDDRGRILSNDSSPEFPSFDRIGENWFDIFVSTHPKIFSREFFFASALKGDDSGFVTVSVFQDIDPSYLEWRFKRYGRRCILGVGLDISEWFLNEKRLREEQFRLIGRNRELLCLYGVSQIMGNAELDFEEKIDKITAFIPQALQYPDIASAAITLDSRTWRSPGCPEIEAADILTEKIVICGRRRGGVAVGYAGSGNTEDPMQMAGRPAFLPEERNLLRIIARQVALILEKQESDLRKSELETQLRHADRLAKIGMLSAGIAHEINNPLNNILGFAQLALKTPDLPEQAVSDLGHIVQTSLFAREIIKKLMLFSHQMPTHQRPANLNEAVIDCLSFTERICLKNGVEVVRELSPDLPNLLIDTSQIQQVLVNLIINAVHAMPGGGVLTITTRSENGGILLIIEDTGIGMDQETLDQIFLPFFTTKAVDEGTGLGLSVVYGICEAHGASISVSSQKGEGAVFTIRFPAESRNNNA